MADIIRITWSNLQLPEGAGGGASSDGDATVPNNEERRRKQVERQKLLKQQEYQQPEYLKRILDKGEEPKQNRLKTPRLQTREQLMRSMSTEVATQRIMISELKGQIKTRNQLINQIVNMSNLSEAQILKLFKSRL